MKITCDRPLGAEEMEHLIGEAKLMQITGDKKAWVGDGMLHMCNGNEEFHFVDGVGTVVWNKTLNEEARKK